MLSVWFNTETDQALLKKNIVPEVQMHREMKVNLVNLLKVIPNGKSRGRQSFDNKYPLWFII